MRRRHDHGRRRHPHQREPALVQEGRTPARQQGEAHDRSEPRQPQERQRRHLRERPQAATALALSRGPYERQGRPDQQPGSPRVRPVVDARDCAAGLVERGHRDGRSGRPGHDQGEDVSLVQQRQSPCHQQRPDHVELFLHRQRPEVAQQRGPLPRVEVRLARHDQVPVRDVGERRRDVVPEAGGLVRGEEQAVAGYGEEQQEERRQQPACPAQPEAPQGDAAPAGSFRQQRPRDDVPADDEEDLDAEEAAGRDPEGGVEEHHRDHGQRAHAVEARQVALRRRPRGGGRQRSAPNRPRFRPGLFRCRKPMLDSDKG